MKPEEKNQFLEGEMVEKEPVKSVEEGVELMKKVYEEYEDEKGEAHEEFSDTDWVQTNVDAIENRHMYESDLRSAKNKFLDIWEDRIPDEMKKAVVLKLLEGDKEMVRFLDYNYNLSKVIDEETFDRVLKEISKE